MQTENFILNTEVDKILKFLAGTSTNSLESIRGALVKRPAGSCKKRSAQNALLYSQNRSKSA